MRYALALILMTSCGQPAKAPTTPTTPPTPATVTAYPPHVSPKGVECSTDEGHTGQFYEVKIYCRNVRDGCCDENGGWTCGNARYVDWYAANCT